MWLPAVRIAFKGLCPFTDDDQPFDPPRINTPLDVYFIANPGVSDGRLPPPGIAYGAIKEDFYRQTHVPAVFSIRL